jgi:hypothetical protein
MKTNTASHLRKLALCLSASVLTLTANAAVINVPYYSEQLYAAYNSVNNNLNQIGTFGIPSGLNNKFTAIAGPGYIGGDYWGDYRTTWQFKLDELGINAADVTSATLKWTRGQILWPSANLAIDVLPISNLSNWNVIPMYGGTTIDTELPTFADPAQTTDQTDITNVFKTALGNATSNSGLALQFYFVGPTGGSSPYQGGQLATMSIDVTTVPEPSTYALVLGGIATLLLIRRRVQS